MIKPTDTDDNRIPELFNLPPFRIIRPVVVHDPPAAKRFRQFLHTDYVPVELNSSRR